MGLLSFAKRLLGLEKAQPMAMSKYRPLAGVPDEYERWENEDGGQGVDSRFYNPGNDLLDFLTLYQVHPWVFSAAQAIATAIAGVPYRIKDDKGEEVKSGEIVQTFKKPNPHEVWYEFSELGRIYLECSGNMFIEEVRDISGNLLAMYLLRPDKVRILPHPKIKVAGYIYEPRPGAEILYSPNEITHVKYASSLDEYFGISPAYAAQNSIILDMYSTTYNKRFFTNSAVPEGVLQTEGSLSDQTYQRLKRDWAKRHQGVNRAFEMAVLEEGLKYVPIGFNQRDMMMVELKDMSREDVLSCFRVPPAIVGLLKGAHLGGLQEQRKMFYTDNVFPKCEKFQQILNQHLMPKGFEFEYVLDEVSALIEDIQISTQVAMSLVSHGIMSINEVRKRYFAMKDVAWGNKPWMPVGLAQWDPNPATSLHPDISQRTIPQLSQTQRPAQALNQSTPMGGSLPDADRAVVGKQVEFEKMSSPDPIWTDKKSVRDWKVWNIWKGLATPDYLELKAFFKKLFLTQFNQVAPILRANYHPKKVEKKSGLSRLSKMLEENYEDPYTFFKDEYDDLSDAISVKINFDDKKTKAAFGKKAQAIIKKHGQFKMGQIGVNVQFDAGNPRVEEFLKQMAGAQIKGIDNTTKRLLRRELSKAYRKGEDFQDMMERVDYVFKGELSEDRIRKIARTEVVTLTQWTALEAALQSGVVQKKRWVCSLIPKSKNSDGSRESHVDVHDTTIDLEKQFDVKSRSGVDKMYGPGDPEASAENIVECLCVLDFPGSTPELESLEGDIDDARD